MTRYNFDPVNNDYKSNAASGLVFSGSAQVIKILSQFISIVVLARLLSPEDFGLMAMVLPIYAFATMFCDLGISNAIIQRKNLTHEQVNALFWTNVAIGLAVTLFLCAISPLVGMFYEDPRTVPLTIAMALMVGISSLGVQHGTIMRRRLMFKTQSMIAIISVVLGVVVSIAVAALYKTYWALFAGLAVTTLVASLGVWVFIRWLPGRPAWAEGATDMFKFGLGIASGNFMGFFVYNISTVVIGKAFGTHALGLYDRSNKLLVSPLQQATYPISGVVVPLLHRLQDDEERYRRIFLRALASLMFVLSPGIIWSIVSSESLIIILLGDEWHEAIPLFAILSLSALPRLMNMATNWLFETQGRSGEYARSSFYRGIGNLVAIIIGVNFGIMGVVIAVTAYQYLMTPVLWWFTCRKGAVTIKHLMHKLLPLTCGLALSGIIVYFWHMVDIFGQIIDLGIGLGFSYIFTILVMLLFPVGRANIKTDMDFAFYVLGKATARLPLKSKTQKDSSNDT